MILKNPSLTTGGSPRQPTMSSTPRCHKLELQSLHLQEAGSLAADDHIHGAHGAGSHMPHLKRNPRVSVKWLMAQEYPDWFRAILFWIVVWIGWFLEQTNLPKSNQGAIGRMTCGILRRSPRMLHGGNRFRLCMVNGVFSGVLVVTRWLGGDYYAQHQTRTHATTCLVFVVVFDSGVRKGVKTHTKSLRFNDCSQEIWRR